MRHIPATASRSTPGIPTGASSGQGGVSAGMSSTAAIMTPIVQTMITSSTSLNSMDPQ